MKKILFLHIILAAVLSCAISSPLLAATAIVPTDYATVQEAVDAVEGTPDARVIIQSNATFEETVSITQSVTIEAGTGYTPTLQGVSSCTIDFSPNSTMTQNLTIRDLILLPKTGLTPGTTYHIIEIWNDGTGETIVVLDGLTLNDPENGGPDGVYVRSSGGPNNVTVQNTTITLGGGPSHGVYAFLMSELGTLTVADVTVNMSLGDGWGFYIRGNAGSGITFTLEDSTFTIAAPLAAYSAEVGRLMDFVTATIRRNTFNLTSNVDGSASGILAGWGSQDVIMDSNRFNGFGPSLGYAYGAGPFEGDTNRIIATNNVICNMGGGIDFSPQSGTPGGVVNAILINNTIDGCLTNGVKFSLFDNTIVNATIYNNILSNNGWYGFKGNIGAGATLTVTNSHNDFFNNTLGATDGTVSIGPHSLYVDPLFVGGGDYHLGSTSPCIDEGENNPPHLLPYTDMDGNRRVVDGPDVNTDADVDMGAYECNSTAPVPHILHMDGAVWSSDTGWEMAMPPYYPGTAYARDFEYHPGGGYGVLHYDGAIWITGEGWELDTPPYYPGTNYAKKVKLLPDGSYCILHTDGAIWNNDTGWNLGTPPYYPGTGYAVDIEYTAWSNFCILHQYGAVYDSEAGWVMTTPPYYPGSAWVVDLKLEGGGYILLHKDGALWSSARGWELGTPPYYAGSDYARAMALKGTDYLILHKDGALYDSVSGWNMDSPPYYPGTNYAVDLEVQ